MKGVLGSRLDLLLGERSIGVGRNLEVVPSLDATPDCRGDVVEEVAAESNDREEGWRDGSAGDRVRVGADGGGADPKECERSEDC